jgi:hypothetical protein
MDADIQELPNDSATFDFWALEIEKQRQGEAGGLQVAEALG